MERPQDQDRAPQHSLSLDDLARVRGLLTHAPVRMGLIILTVAIAFAAWNLSSKPVYRSALKLRVDDVTAERPQVEHRAIPTGTVDEGTALTLLRSRTALARLVAVPEDEDDPGLGLTTWVTDESAPPLRRMLRGAIYSVHPKFRLEANAVRESDSAPYAVRLRFVDPDRVSVSGISRPGLEWPQDDAEVLPFREGEPIRYRGLALHVSTDGAPDGRSWRIEALGEDEAIDRVLARLRVDKQQHQTGTLGVTVLDEDPIRAAAIANGVAQVFVEQDLRDARADAEATITFLQAELETRRTALAALTEAERDLHTENPDTIHPDAAALDLGKREGVWDDLHRKTRSRRILADRIELEVAAGTRLSTALAAAGGDLSPEVTALLGALHNEEQQLRQVFRGSSDAGYRQTLLLKADDHRLEAERFATRVDDLTDIIDRLRDGDLTVLSQLGGDLAREGSVSVDWNMRLWITELEKTRKELKDLEDEFTGAYPPVIAARERVDFYRGEILGGLVAVRRGLERTLQQKQGYAASWSALYDAYPESEAELVRASVKQLRKEGAEAFSSYAAGLRAQEEAAAQETERIRTRLRTLASAKQALKGTQLEARELDRIVGELLRDVENARVAAAGIVPSARIIDPARPARAPLKPSGTFGLLAGLVLGVLVAVAWAWFELQRTPRSGAASSGALIRMGQLPILGRVATTGLKDGPKREMTLLRGEAGPQPSWLPMMEDPTSSAAQTYRTLRARMRGLTPARGTGEAPRAFGLVSATAGEGAETVAINLGMARAQLGERVLVIDGHLASPTLRATIASTGLEPVGYLDFESDDLLVDRETQGHVLSTRGLGEALDGSSHWTEIAAPSGFPNLDVLFAGASEVVPTDLLASQVFEALCEETSKAYDTVLIHLPSLAESPDALAAAAALDGILFVEATFAAEGQNSASAIERLEQSGGRVVGLVETLAVERRRKVQADAGDEDTEDVASRERAA